MRHSDGVDGATPGRTRETTMVKVERLNGNAATTIGEAGTKRAVQTLVTEARRSGRARITGTEEALRKAGAVLKEHVGWSWEGTKRYVPCVVVS
jgi:hypothetical protein